VSARVNQRNKWLESIVKMIPGTDCAVITFPEDNTLAQPISTKNAVQETQLLHTNKSLTWPTDLPIDNQLYEFAKFGATQKNPISSVLENVNFSYSLPIKNAENKVLCYLAIKLNLKDQNKDSCIAIIEWAGIWLGHLLEQQFNHPQVKQLTQTSDVEPTKIVNPPTESKQSSNSVNRLRTFIQRHWKRLLTALIILIVLFMPIDYRISAPGTIKGKIESSISAPFNGFIEQVYVKPGDTVRLDQALASLDSMHISLKLDKLLGDFQEKQKMYRKALAEGKRGPAEIHKSQMVQIRSNISLAEQDIKNSKLKSQIEGTVIEGDLRELIGTAVSKGDLLFKVAPTNEYRVILDIQETDIRFIKQGQQASLKLASLPDIAQMISLDSPSPVFSQENNQLTYKVEAQLSIETNASFSSGMQGIAKISVGKTTAAWYLFHHFYDWIRLQWWNFKP
jgi:multidrug resistance efflux pump